MILAKWGIEGDNVPQKFLPTRPLSCRSTVIHAIGDRSCQFRLTGVYLPPPPTAKMKPELLETLTRKNKYDAGQDARLNHLLCGDFNPTEWRENFEIWLGEAGLWELTDPDIPTFETGPALDRI